MNKNKGAVRTASKAIRVNSKKQSFMGNLLLLLNPIPDSDMDPEAFSPMTDILPAAYKSDKECKESQIEARVHHHMFESGNSHDKTATRVMLS